jgi:hypothetical protein
LLPKDRLFRLLAVNGILGAFLGAVFVAGLIALDTAGLRRLILGDPQGLVALALLLAGFVVTCASVMMGSAVMRAFSTKDDRPPRGGLRQETPLGLELAKAGAAARRG